MRFLITYSYLGTHFKTGVQKQLAGGIAINPETSVQGILELCLQRFKPLNVPSVVLSSRTDQGVHALKTTAHVDLERPGGKNYDPQWLMHGLNRSFEKLNIDIRIQKIQTVPDDFHARFNAISRTYLYRFAVRKRNCKLNLDRGLDYVSPIPVSECRRCYFVQKENFDATQLPKIASLFVGTHDFSTFMGKPNQQPKDKDTVKTIHQCEIRPGRTLLSVDLDPIADQYEFWELICKGRSFLYRQAALEEKRRKLKPAQTQITLSNGEVYVESRTPQGHSELRKLTGVMSPGFVIDNKPDLQVGHVFPRLLVGSQDVASDAELLKSLAVTHVLSVGVSATLPLPEITHHYLELLDLPESNILPVVESACDFIHRALQNNSAARVLVHCNAGVSRAPTVAIAYLIKYENMNVDQAVAHMRKCRPNVKPNDGFLKQLHKFCETVKIHRN